MPVRIEPNRIVINSTYTIGDTSRQQMFVGKLLDISGDTRLLWLETATSATSSTDRSRNARTFTYSGNINAFAAPPSRVGAGLQVDFDGTDDEADVPDNDDFSFGDSANDQPFSIIALINPDTISGTDVILSKYDLTTGSTKREWRIYLNAGVLSFAVYDESAAANIGRSYSSTLSTSTWVLVTVTYDGSRASTGVRVFKNAARVDDTNVNSGTYVAMENTASLARLAFEQGASAGQSFFDGKMAFVALVGKELSDDEIWQMKEVVNEFYGLSL